MKENLSLERFNYRFFLFNKLADVCYTPKTEYDNLFEKRVALFDEFNAIPGDSTKNEYELMEAFLNSKVDSKMTPNDVIKICDVYHRRISENTIKHIESTMETTYRDTVLTEHLYSVDELLVDAEDGPKELIEELNWLHELCASADAAYLRIIYIEG